MRRAFARMSLVAVMVGVPAVLYALGGPPRIPDFDVPGGLSSTYLPLDPVLQVLALLAWALWAYLVVVLVLRAVVSVLVARGAPGGRGLLTMSNFLTPGPIRQLVDLAVGGAFLAATFSASRSLASTEPIARQPSVVAFEERGTAAAAQQPAKEPTRSYAVKPGDSLWRIAERELGSGFRWREIYQLNRGRSFPDGRSFSNPRLIQPGWTLRLPSDGRRETPGRRQTPTARVQSESEPVIVPSPQTSLTTPSPAPSAIASDERMGQRTPTPTVRLPSGAIVAASFASGLLTAELLGRLRRRRAFRPLSPRSSTEPLRTDPKLIRELRFAGASPVPGRLDVALEAVAEAWQAATSTWPRFLLAVEDEHGALIDLDGGGSSPPAPSGGSVSPRVTFSRRGGLVRAEVREPFPTQLRRTSSPLQLGLSVPLGYTADGNSVHVSLLGTAGISIAGDRSAGLARQMLLALASSGAAEDLEIVALGSALTELELASLPHLRSECGWDASEDVLRTIQTESLRRARIMFEERVEDLSTHLAIHPDERFTALLIVATEPPPGLRGLVEAIARQAPSFGAAVIALGWTSEATGVRTIIEESLSVESSLPIPSRLEPFILDQAAAEQALTVIRETHEAEETDDGEDDTSSHEKSVVLTIPPPQPALPVAVVEEREPPPVSIAEESKPPAAIDSPPFTPPPSIQKPVPPPGVPAVRCLGPLTLARDGKSPQKGLRSNAFELVAYLVAYPAGASRDRLIEALWPDVQPRRADLELNRAAHHVRRLVRGPNDNRPYIERDGESFRLEEGAWWCDAWEFERLISEVDQAPEPAVAAARLRQALALYEGEFCDDKYYSWAEPVRESLRSLFLRASTRLSELLCDLSEPRAALETLNRAIAVDPLCEDLHRRAMVIEAALGDRARALARHKELARLLAEQLSIQPSPETEALARQIEGPRVQHAAHVSRGPVESANQVTLDTKTILRGIPST